MGSSSRIPRVFTRGRIVPGFASTVLYLLAFLLSASPLLANAITPLSYPPGTAFAVVTAPDGRVLWAPIQYPGQPAVRMLDGTRPPLVPYDPHHATPLPDGPFVVEEHFGYVSLAQELHSRTLSPAERALLLESPFVSFGGYVAATVTFARRWNSRRISTDSVTFPAEVNAHNYRSWQSRTPPANIHSMFLENVNAVLNGADCVAALSGIN